MTFIESQSSACSADQCTVRVAGRTPRGRGKVVARGGRMACGGEACSTLEGLHEAGRCCIQWGKSGCAQCAHPGLQIRLYRQRTGPDSGCFRGSGGFSRVGARFESHLGHSVSSQGLFSL
jgi:hypothetical protein